MEKRQKTGIIMSVILISAVCLSVIILNVSFFDDMFSEISKQLLLMLLYAVIPCVPVVILRRICRKRSGNICRAHALINFFHEFVRPFFCFERYWRNCHVYI